MVRQTVAVSIAGLLFASVASAQVAHVPALSFPRYQGARNWFLGERGAVAASEVEQFKAWLASVDPRSPDRPAILFRIAEDYVSVELWSRARSLPTTRGHLPPTTWGVDPITRAREAAIRYYRILIDEHPSYAGLDGAYLYLGSELEEAGDIWAAQSAYRALVDKRPASSLAVLAYLALGDLAFDRAALEPSEWVTARTAYGKVVTHQPTSALEQGAVCYAHYRLAYVEWNRGHSRLASAALENARDCANRYPGAQGRGPLLEEVGKALALARK
jgi:tetratricopeptide (TPR) repeat protein